MTPMLSAAPLWAAIPWNDLISSPLAWGVLSGAISLLLLIPGSSQRAQTPGLAFAGAALILLGLGLGRADSLGAQISFWVLAALTVGSAGAAIAMRSAVYSAIWFAVSLLGTGGLFCLQNAQFLGVATVVVYAGAIVVTFLFVVMLAQPEGHDAYDRISWGPLAKPIIVGSATLLLGLVLGTVGPALGVLGPTPPVKVAALAAAAPTAAVPQQTSSEAPTAPATDKPEAAAPAETSVAVTSVAGTSVAGTSSAESVSDGVSANIKSGRSAIDTIDHRGHMARLGSVLFSRHLLAVEVGGTLLLAALVGAVAIVIQGRDERAKSPAGAGEERDHG
ncbi:MAG: NADH-quinone oxidoreductase subunit J [Planctomycetota bacterium]